jgi:hypothetical protein
VEVLKLRPPGKPDQTVFYSALGGLRDRDNGLGDLRNALNAAGFEWVTGHTCRRTVPTHTFPRKCGSRGRYIEAWVTEINLQAMLGTEHMGERDSIGRPTVQSQSGGWIAHGERAEVKKAIHSAADSESLVDEVTRLAITRHYAKRTFLVNQRNNRGLCGGRPVRGTAAPVHGTEDAGPGSRTWTSDLGCAFRAPTAGEITAS